MIKGILTKIHYSVALVTTTILEMYDFAVEYWTPPHVGVMLRCEYPIRKYTAHRRFFGVVFLFLIRMASEARCIAEENLTELRAEWKELSRI